MEKTQYVVALIIMCNRNSWKFELQEFGQDINNNMCFQWFILYNPLPLFW